MLLKDSKRSSSIAINAMAALPLVPGTATRVAPDEPYIFVRVRVALADVAYRVDPASALLLAKLRS